MLYLFTHHIADFMIYIPLCLYLYPLRRYFIHTPELIYIPLCLYLYFLLLPVHCFLLQYLHSTMFIFIFFQQYPVHTAFPFTFHYVYIYIELIVSDNETIDIYIPLCLYLYTHELWGSAFFVYLHSTMFIFIFFPV